MDGITPANFGRIYFSLENPRPPSPSPSLSRRAPKPRPPSASTSSARAPRPPCVRFPSQLRHPSAGDMVKSKNFKTDDERSLGLQKPYLDSDLTDNINHNENISQMSGDFKRALVLSVPKEKMRKRKQREKEISALEEMSLRKDIPRTTDEFDKLVRSSPNSSFVWINYMAFLVDLADVEKARSVAERRVVEFSSQYKCPSIVFIKALRTINIREEEEEKLNVWVAYLNLENLYGSQDSVKKVFQRALQYCDPKKVHLALLGMYERTAQDELADELVDRMTKRFKTSCKIWLRRIQFSLRQGKDVGYIESVVNRALLSLPQSKRVRFLSQSAILEFKCGVPEQGRSRFELILWDYPKRTDLWSVYLDQEIRLGDTEIIRALFERVTCLSIPDKKMKFLFKKYLEYEKSQGDEERIEHVKQKALEFFCQKEMEHVIM